MDMKKEYCGTENDQDSESTDVDKRATDWNRRQNHNEIEKRRRNKMNRYIVQLSRIIPVRTSQKLDKLTVLRMAVMHLKAIGVVPMNSSNQRRPYKPNCLSDSELNNLIYQASDGFLFVVGCDRGRIMHVSESVRRVLNYSKAELLDTSWFDILHPKDLSKVKEQLTSADMTRRDRLVDSRTLLPVQFDLPQELSRLSPGLRRSFFCRIRIKSEGLSRKTEDSNRGQRRKTRSEKKYAVIHFTGYLRSWQSPIETESGAEEIPEGDLETLNTSCLVAVGRIHEPLLSSVRRDSMRLSRVRSSQPVEYVSKHTSDGKFLFVSQEVTLLLGWLPQELLGTSIYEYFRSEDVAHLSECHSWLLKTHQVQSSKVFGFRCKNGTFLYFRSDWKTFRNPWTKEVEYIILKNHLTSCEELSSESVLVNYGPAATHSNCEREDSPGLWNDDMSSSSSSVIDKGSHQASKIGQKIVEEALNSQQVWKLPEIPMPLSPIQEPVKNEIFEANSSATAVKDSMLASCSLLGSPSKMQYSSGINLASNEQAMACIAESGETAADSVFHCPNTPPGTYFERGGNEMEPPATEESVMSIFRSLLVEPDSLDELD